MESPRAGRYHTRRGGSQFVPTDVDELFNLQKLSQIKKDDSHSGSDSYESSSINSVQEASLTSGRSITHKGSIGVSKKTINTHHKESMFSKKITDEGLGGNNFSFGKDLKLGRIVIDYND